MIGQSQDSVVIVSGLPRSGTSMMMQMIEAGGVPVLSDARRSADNDNPRGYYEYEPVKSTRKDASWVANAVGKAVKVVHLLLMDLPAVHQYKVVFMRRPLEEVLASQTKMLHRKGQDGASLPPEQLAKAFGRQLDKVANWLADQSNFDVLYVEHRQVLADPQAQAARINQFLCGTLDTTAMAAVVDPSLYRQRF